MRHPTIESLIGLAEGMLSPQDKQDVEDHMLNCAQCFAEASAFLVVELQICLESQKRSSVRPTGIRGTLNRSTPVAMRNGSQSSF